jgi:predicted RND superfamily exporter protein
MTAQTGQTLSYFGDLGWLNAGLRRPRLFLALALAVCLALGGGLKGVVKDTSVDAFVPLDHPAALARDEARQVFGLDDPIVIALAAPEEQSVFTPEGLEALRRIHDAVRTVPGVKKTDVLSLASEKAILGLDGDLLVEPVIEAGPVTQASAAQAWSRVQAMPMMLDLLASRSGDLVTILVPVEDPNHAGATVDAVKAIVATETPEGLTSYVAGVATMNARLAHIVDSDTRIFIPAAVLTVLLILLVALQNAKALIGPLCVIAMSAAATIGLMGWLDARYYLITTALPVVIMAIAVADSLHITSFYLKSRRLTPEISAEQAAVQAVRHTFLPVTLTSVTTIAGFVGLSFGAAMRPISEFGLFAAFGVAVAWALSVTALPAILVLTNLRGGLKAKASQPQRTHRIDRALQGLSTLAGRRPGTILFSMAVFTALLGFAAAQARFDYERKYYFTTDDAVRIADAVLDERLGGVNFLDVMVTAPEPGGLLTPEALRAIADLRTKMASLPHVSNVSGIDEHIAVMHAALNPPTANSPEGQAPTALPTAAQAPAQYMFLYEASAPPDDFRQEIDYDHQRALIRAQLTTDSYSQTRPVVEALEEFAAQWSQSLGLQAAVSGRVAVNDGWMSQLAETHFRGLGLAVLLVGLTCLLMFRSVGSAVIVMLPVLTGVLFVYASMGLFGIDIAPATSMTAAIATGLGVDFGIHLHSHIRNQLRAGASVEQALAGDFILVARACLYSALALGLALAVICLSSAPPLRWFGLLVSIGAVGSLFGAMLFIPAWTVLMHRLRDKTPLAAARSTANLNL